MKEYIVAVPEHLAGDLFKDDPLLIRCKIANSVLRIKYMDAERKEE